MTKPTRTEDLVEIQQLLAKYALTITQGDIDGLISVFTKPGLRTSPARAAAFASSSAPSRANAAASQKCGTE